jgi:hypothetical protein
MIPAEFIHKWKPLHLTEKAGAQAWFLDLCAMLDVPAPGQDGLDYTFEKNVAKLTGGSGFADAWRRGCFAWEFKGRGENLDKAYQQLKGYAEALENPPLLVVSDFDRILVRTNFTNTQTKTHRFTLGPDSMEPDPRLPKGRTKDTARSSRVRLELFALPRRKLSVGEDGVEFSDCARRCASGTGHSTQLLVSNVCHKSSLLGLA